MRLLIRPGEEQKGGDLQRQWEGMEYGRRHFSDAQSRFFFFFTSFRNTQGSLLPCTHTEQTLQRGMNILRHGTSFHDVEFKEILSKI